MFDPLLERRRCDDLQPARTRCCEYRFECFHGCWGHLHDLVKLVDEENQLPTLGHDVGLCLVEESFDLSGHVIGQAHSTVHSCQIDFEVDPLRVVEHRVLDQDGLSRAGRSQQQDVGQSRTAERSQHLLTLVLTADDPAYRR